VNGIVIGFMGVIGRALTAAIAYANEEHSDAPACPLIPASLEIGGSERSNRSCG
jgi:hypothetical protein